MQRPPTKWRTARRWLLWLIVAVLLVIGLLPVWLPWVAGPILHRYGLSYGGYDRLGITRIVLTDVKGQWQQTHLQAGQVECVLPTVWLWQKWMPNTNSSPTLIVRDGLLTVASNTNAVRATASRIDSTFEVLDLIERIANVLRTQLPTAQLTNCKIVIPSSHFDLPSANWQDGNLRARFRPAFSPELFELNARFADRTSLAISVAGAAYQARLQGKLTRDTNRWHWNGEAIWLTNHAVLTGRFTPDGWWPDQARLEGQNLRLPADRARLSGYQDATVSVLLNLVSNQFTLLASGEALPLPSEESPGLPPVQAELRAHGNPDSVTLDELHLEAPWARAELTNSLAIRRTGKLLDQAAQFQINLDLEKVPGLALTGQTHCLLSVDLDETNHPVTRFELAGTDLRGWDFAAKTADVRGVVDWPLLTLETASVNLEDGSMLTADGVCDLAVKSVRTANWHASGPILQRFLPVFSYDAFESSGTARGPLTQLSHAGKITIANWQGGVLKPVQAKASWQAEGLKFSLAELELTAADSVLSVKGEIDLSALKQNAMTARLQNASLQRQGELLYVLQQPSALTLSYGTESNTLSDWKLTVGALDLRGNQKGIAISGDVDWPRQGELQINLQQAAPEDFSDFVNLGVSNVSVAQLDLSAQWSNGPVRFALNGEGAVKDQRGRTWSLTGRMAGGDDLQINELILGSELTPVLSAEGTLPLQIVPTRGTNWLVPVPAGTLALDLHPLGVSEDYSFPLGSAGGLQISHPQLQAKLSGTFDHPSATLTFKAASAQWLTPTNITPDLKLDQLQLDATFTPELVTLDSLTATLDQQLIKVSGQWPLSVDDWKKLWSEQQPPDWRQAHGHLRIPDAHVSALARYLPAVIAPEGRLGLDFELEPGGQLAGWLTLTNAATRPLGNLGPLRDISARIAVKGFQAVLEDFQGLAGGHPVKASGRVEFPLKGQWNYQVELRGSNVPLARSLEFLLRGDLDLKLNGGRESPPTLSGDVSLHHGLYVKYASDMFWSGPKRPEMVPPYFSVTNAPFADWKLDVNIRGDEFLRVRVPIFNGILSGDVNVGGTLRNPRTTGDVRVKSGRVMFPFGTLKVEDGYASLSGNDPHGPTIGLRAAGRALNYNLRLDVAGPLDGANVTFSSTPPLNSEEILLLLTAGENPDKQYTFNNQARAGSLATYLGKDFFARSSEKNSGESRLIITSGESISDDGKLTYSVEYLLNDRWSIIGEYDRFNEFNANLKWKVLSR